jgi:putative ABC transport system permease protein
VSHLLGIRARLRSLFSRRTSDSRMNEEFRFHLDMEAEANERRGMTSDEARRRALLAFGGADRHREEMRDGRGARWAHDVIADVRYALRTLRRAPGLAIAAAVTLGLGIGVNGLVFSTVNGLLFRPIPTAQPDRLVALFGLHEQTGQADGLGYEEFLDYREKSGVFAGLAAQTELPLNVKASDAADVMWGAMVTEDFFSVLGLAPAVGRFFDGSTPGADPYAVLSWDSWQARFDGTPVSWRARCGSTALRSRSSAWRRKAFTACARSDSGRRYGFRSACTT